MLSNTGMPNINMSEYYINKVRNYILKFKWLNWACPDDSASLTLVVHFFNHYEQARGLGGVGATQQLQTCPSPYKFSKCKRQIC
jgi:hypothetical protein